MSTDTSPEFLMACLARKVMADCRSTADMSRWFDRWEQIHGPAARAELRAAVVAEKMRSALARQSDGEGEPLNDHEQRKADLLANRESYEILGADNIAAAVAERGRK